MSETKTDSDAAGEDDWAAAMAEQAEASEASDTHGMTADAETEPAHASSERRARAGGDDEQIFRPLENNGDQGRGRDLDMIMEIPVTLSVQLGQTRLTIRELLDLAKGSIVELDGLAGEPMNILINGYLIAQGEVVVVDDKYGIRITEIVGRSERLHKLNQ